MRFKRRRPASVAVDTTGLTHCSMCGQGVRVDQSGRCVLGHRVFTAASVAPALDTERPEDWADPAPVAWSEPTVELADTDTAELWSGEGAADPWPAAGADETWQPDPAVVSEDPAPSWAAPFSDPETDPLDAWTEPVSPDPEPAAWSVTESWTMAPEDDSPQPVVDDYAGLLGWDSAAEPDHDEVTQDLTAADPQPRASDEPGAPAIYEIAAPDDDEGDEREMRRRTAGLFGGAVATMLCLGASVVLAL